MQAQLKKATQEWASLFTNLPLKKWWAVPPKWITVLLVILLAKSASDLTWLVFAPEEKQMNVRNQQQRINNRQIQTQQPRLRSVAELHLFGVAKRAPVVSSVPIEATPTKLKLTLRGVFAADNPDVAMAIIAGDRGDEKVYKKSDTIFRGVTLHEIYPDKVILERSGSFETLALPRDELKSNNGSTYRASTRVQRPAVRNRNAGQVRTRTIRAGKQLAQLRNQLNTNPTEFWQQVRIEPVHDNSNNVKGYRFNHNDRQMLRALGLRQGDVILEINGNPLSDPSALVGLLGEMQSQSTISLAIERNGRRENININM